ncbi:glycosyltransferase family 9 protein [Sporomusa malonica]|uniref:Lipopolysaccharide heptosyltransferase I/lipopolysaccharide heptosyltransferase II,TIGR02195 n=1 Tax=Sporomusa malonica TaxID=112901 RepID=A0A1W2C1U9_9FIRM|nr:glycosyltransferase family 9 protein [Sporomusa malonica]SMC79153.1 lipopolysaccharide heptosyltransferase I/lipopolysaccharide heptosyltransferase II,TIGR02195 [Sporomusa malonica]
MSKEILIIRLSSIGDVIHCTPVAGALKAAWPDCRITWLVGEVCADLIKYNPSVDETMIWPRERFDKHLRAYEFKQALALWRSLQNDLAAREFYAALDIHGLFLTGMITRQVRTGQRIGMSEARELNPLFMSQTAKPLGPHITQRYLSVLKPLGITPADQHMTLVIPAEAEQFAENYIKAQGIITPPDKIAVLVPGTTWPAKNWPPELFARTAELLAKDFKIILCGGKAELPMGCEIEAKAGVSVNNAIGQTSLLEMAGILSKAAVVVAGDTGPLYMAAALATPTVTLFGPTNPETYAPPGKQHAIVVTKRDCGFCHKTKCRYGTNECMNSIKPEAVVEQVYNLVR